MLDRMIALVEGATRQKTPNEIALTVLLAALTIIFLVVVATLLPFAGFVGAQVVRHGAGGAAGVPDSDHHRRTAAGHRHRRHEPRAARQVIAKSGKAVEVAGDIDMLLLDKTGTVTRGDRHATEFLPVGGVAVGASAADGAARLAGRPDARGQVDRQSGPRSGQPRARPADAISCHSPRKTRMSGVGRRRRCAASARVRPTPSAVRGRRKAAPCPTRTALVDRVARRGATPLVVAESHRVLGVIALADIIKPGIKRALPASARHGRAHGDGHRRQPAHRGRHRRRGRCRRLHGRGASGRQARAHPRRTG